METNEIVQAPEHYNPNQLVTYKVINDGNVTYPTSKVVDLEWTLQNARYSDDKLASLRLSINTLEESLAGWIENDDSAEDIVSEICDIFGFNPTKDIEFQATVSISGTISVPLKEIGDFDIDSVDLNIDVNSWSHEVDVDSIEVDEITSL
jgi:hypothetical protein